MADGFERARAEIKAAASRVDTATPAQRYALDQECGVAEAAAMHFRSYANQARFVLARRALAAAKTADDAAVQRATLERVLKDEIALARRLHGIQTRDSRISFEASNQYNYVPVDLREKVLNYHDLLVRISKPTAGGSGR